MNLMRNFTLIIIIIILFSLSLQSQENISSVEKSIYSFQIGTASQLGAWFQNETKLSSTIALRTEVGLYTEIQSGVGFFMAPEITLEPRWYYNLEKRNTKGKNISNNAGNFLTLKLNHRSDLFEVNKDRGSGPENSISIIPKWGLKRNLGKYFNYEVGAGIGYIHFINQKYFRTFDNNGIAIDIHLRIGYNF